MQLTLRRIDRLYIGLFRFGLFETYDTLEGSHYGHFIVYENTIPRYVVVAGIPECGSHWEEIRYHVDKHSLAYIKFLSNIINYETNLSLITKHKGMGLIYFSEKKTHKQFDLELLNIDKFWSNLSEVSLKKVIRKSKKSIFDFLFGY